MVYELTERILDIPLALHERPLLEEEFLPAVELHALVC